MGASIIGHPCERHIWLTWRWALTPSFPGRILRLFDTGKREEARLLEELKNIGAQVWEKDPETGEQWNISDFDGHFGGSLDGVAKGLPEAPKSVAVLEFKTHSNKSFNDLVKKKVRESKPQHFDQMTVYMGKMEIDRALYMAVNKDTDDLYTEWVHFDEDRYAVLLARAKGLIESSSPPPRMTDDPAYFQCKMCNFWKHCHGGVAAEANCRTCCYSSPVANAEWECSKIKCKLTEQEQREGCDQHLMIPGLIPYAEPTDGGEAWVAYKHKTTGVMFVNGPEGIKDYGPVFSSKELHNCPGELIADVIKYKDEFPVTKVLSGDVEDPFDLNSISTHPDDIPVKAPDKTKKEQARKVKAAVNSLEMGK